MIDTAAIKGQSEKFILGQGGMICDWLPYIEETIPRSREDIVSRSLILNAMLEISFGAPIPVIREWIARQKLNADLSKRERSILEKSNDALTDQEKINLRWYIECLWAFMWAGSLTENLDPKGAIPNHMASLAPDLKKGEDGSKFATKMKILPYEELYIMRDLFYRAHWHTVHCRLNGLDPKGFSWEIIMERRRALEWIMNIEEDWDNVDMST